MLGRRKNEARRLQVAMCRCRFLKFALSVTPVMLLVLWHGCTHAQLLCPWHRAAKHMRVLNRTGGKQALTAQAGLAAFGLRLE